MGERTHWPLPVSWVASWVLASRVLASWVLASWVLASWVAAAPADAQDAPRLSEFRLRATGAVGYVVSADQHAHFDLELPVVEGVARAGWVALPPLVLELGLGAGGYFADRRPPGALLDLTLGAELAATESFGRMWVAAHAGIGVTGDLVRPVLRLGVGIDFTVDDVVALGPTFGYVHVFQDDGPAQSDDSVAISVGLSLTIRPPMGEPEREAPPPTPPPAPRVLRAPPGPPYTPPEPVAEEVLLEMIDEAAGLRPRELLVPVLFAFDSTELVPCTLPALHQLRMHLAGHPEIALLEIEGHADGDGDQAYNDALALRRAEAIRDWLVERGIDPARLRVTSRGEAAPIEDNTSDEGRFQNRRARFLVVREGR